MKNKHIVLFFILLTAAFMVSPIQRSILTQKYADEFLDPIQKDIERGCFLESPKKIRIQSYSEQTAEFKMTGESRSTYHVTMQKQDGEWTSFTGEYCDFDILNSTMGGSADSLF